MRSLSLSSTHTQKGSTCSRHTRQSGPDSGLGFKAKVVEGFNVFLVRWVADQLVVARCHCPPPTPRTAPPAQAKQGVKTKIRFSRQNSMCAAKSQRKTERAREREREREREKEIDRKRVGGTKPLAFFLHSNCGKWSPFPWNVADLCELTATT